MSRRWKVLAVILAPVLGGPGCAPAANLDTDVGPISREAPINTDSVRVLLCGWLTCDLVTMPAIERVLQAVPQVPTKPAIQPGTDGRSIPHTARAQRGRHVPETRR